MPLWKPSWVTRRRSTNVDAVSTNVDAVSTNVDAVSTNVDAVSTNVDAVSTNVDAVSTNVDAVSKNVDAVSMDVDAVSTNANAASTNADAVSTEISAQALLILEQIYCDIRLASLGTLGWGDNIIAATSTRILSSVSEAMMNEDTPRDLQLQRFIALGKSLSWMMLATCSHSTGFIAAAAATGDKDDLIWEELCSLIRENDISIELFAKIRRLSLPSSIPGATQLDLGGQLRVEAQSIYPYVIKPVAKTIYRPEHLGRRQENITKSRLPSNDSHYEIALFRKPYRDGKCAICDSPQECLCTFHIAEDAHPLLELRDYPGRGIGVRTLRSIKEGELIGEYVGEYVGEISHRDYCRDYTYALCHTLRERSIGVIDAAIYGNWTRYMNHSCRAGAIFVSAVVEDRVCVLVRAIRDIEMYEEITVDYGAEYFMPRDRLCKCGEDVCRFKENKEYVTGMGPVKEVGGFLPLYKSFW
ncbi:hypothetical protein GX51_01723 [Blastomyces parvus]|uniref:SET domain-containing protein n=1 Tax=Blastomyces parvus TaxID=2060905 RepID=A0A2B7X6Z7_9EURO|nr:hypothetical protein GX51_01723 [Blastomyces parvus]